MAKHSLKLHSERKVTLEWSKRSKAWINFDHVTSIGYERDPMSDPDGEDDFIFDWTLVFVLDGIYDIQLGYYCDESQVKQEALAYARECWGKED